MGRSPDLTLQSSDDSDMTHRARWSLLRIESRKRRTSFKYHYKSLNHRNYLKFNLENCMVYAVQQNEGTTFN